MSRRLETISTGFVDVSKGIESFNTAYTRAKQLQLEEERYAHQKSLEEQARMKFAQDWANTGNDALMKQINGLDQSQIKGLTSRYKSIEQKYIDLKFKLRDNSVKYGSEQFDTYNSEIENEKNSLIFDINGLKKINEAKHSISQLGLSGKDIDPEILPEINKQEKLFLSGTWNNKATNGVDINVDYINNNSYIPAHRILKEFSNDVRPIPHENISQDENGNKVKETSYIPSYFATYSNAEKYARTVSGRTKEKLDESLQSFKNNPNAEKSFQYKQYKDWMDLVSDESNKTEAKSVKDFSIEDYLVMEGISTGKISLAPKHQEYFVTERQTQKKYEDFLMKDYMDKLFSGDEKKSNSVISQLSGALEQKGFKIETINKGGKYMDTNTGSDVPINEKGIYWKEAGNIFRPNEIIQGFLPLTRSDKSEASAVTMLHSAFKALGKEGVKYLYQSRSQKK